MCRRFTRATRSATPMRRRLLKVQGAMSAFTLRRRLARAMRIAAPQNRCRLPGATLALTLRRRLAQAMRSAAPMRRCQPGAMPTSTLNRRLARATRIAVPDATPALTLRRRLAGAMGNATVKRRCRPGEQRLCGAVHQTQRRIMLCAATWCTRRGAQGRRAVAYQARRTIRRQLRFCIAA